MQKFSYKVGDYTITECVREITPKEASNIVATRNPKNRRPNKYHVAALAKNMTNGTWRYNADPIRFDANGILIDGQHRLLAVAKANKPILFKVVYGLDPECFKSIDIEMKSRNLHDLLFIDNIPNSNNIAGIINRYHAFSLEMSAISKQAQGGVKTAKELNSRITVEDRYEFYYKESVTIEAVLSFVRVLYKKMGFLSISELGGLFLYLYLDKHHSFDEISNFLNQLYVSSNLDCINSLRNKLVNDMAATKKMTGSHRQNLIAKVWNYYIKGKDVKVLSYNPANEGQIEFI